MKNKVFIFFSLIIFFLSSIAWGQDETAPEIFFKEKKFNAGEVIEGPPIEHTYIVYNKGNAVLKIQKVRPGG